MQKSRLFCLRVRGDFACFTRPEMKVERVSYDVITPSALRAIFEAVCWKPAIRWVPQKIEVLNEIRWLNIRRNEVREKIDAKKIGQVCKEGGDLQKIYVDGASNSNARDRQRVQRNSLLLRDVEYRLHAFFALTDKANRKNAADNIPKFEEIFSRRAEKGQCFNQPYLGCREFSADFCLVKDAEAECRDKPPINESRDLGFMLYDINYQNNNAPRLFRADMRRGVIDIPPPDSGDIRG